MTTLTAIEPRTPRVRLGDPRLLTEMLTESDALEHGHFELLSGHHAETFIRFSRIANHSPSLETTARWPLPSVAAWLPEVVLAPATAGGLTRLDALAAARRATRARRRRQ